MKGGTDQDEKANDLTLLYNVNMQPYFEADKVIPVSKTNRVGINDLATVNSQEKTL